MILNYHKHINIEAYISDISDFTIYAGQSILYGEQALLKYVDELKVVNRFNYDVGFNGDKPFFYRNPLLGGNMFLAQNTESLEDAMSVCYNWGKSGVNNQIPARKADPTIYSYSSVERVEEIKSGKKCSILGYKIDNEPRFTVLL